MTMPHERLRALQWAGELLRELAHGQSKQVLWGADVPQELRRQALIILRHYPENHELLNVARWECHPWPKWIGLDPFAPKKATDAGRGTPNPDAGS